MNKNAYRGHRFPPAIIQLTVWMYARFTLSLRDVEEYHRAQPRGCYTAKRTSLPAARASFIGTETKCSKTSRAPLGKLHKA